MFEISRDFVQPTHATQTPTVNFDAQRVQRPKPRRVDLELRSYLENEVSEVTAISGGARFWHGQVVRQCCSKIDRLIYRGADMERAEALHVSVLSNLPSQIIQHLFVRGVDINGLDSLGRTALMCAAETTLRRVSEHRPTPDSSIVALLIALGADRTITEYSGKTALGCFYAASLSYQKSRGKFGTSFFDYDDDDFLESGPFDSTLERMLMPRDGPTAADNNASKPVDCAHP